VIADVQYSRVEQGSADWLQLRQRFITATEIGMITNPARWPTYCQQKGKSVPVTKAMKHGHRYEPVARQLASDVLGRIYRPVTSYSWGARLLASLDGITMSGRRTLEIKCPLTGRQGKAWALATEGRLPKAYWEQIQQGLLLTGADWCDYFVFDASSRDYRHFEVAKADQYHAEIMSKSRGFLMQYGHILS
jgi:putative phage-type endonuclease